MSDQCVFVDWTTGSGREPVKGLQVLAMTSNCLTPEKRTPGFEGLPLAGRFDIRLKLRLNYN